MNNNYTCPVCLDVILTKNDGILRYCKCGSLGVDNTRFIGCVPKESKSFPDWWEQNKSNVLLLRQITK